MNTLTEIEGELKHKFDSLEVHGCPHQGFVSCMLAGIANSVSGAIDVASNICHWK